VYICLPQPLEMKVHILAQLAVWNQERVCFGKNFSKGLGSIHTKCIQTLAVHNGYPVKKKYSLSQKHLWKKKRACLFYNTFSISDYVVSMAGLINKLKCTWNKERGLTEVPPLCVPGGTEKALKTSDDDW